MRSRIFPSVLLVLATFVSQAAAQERVSGDYSVVGGILGSLSGIVAGGIVGGLVTAPSVSRCQEGAGSSEAGLCSLPVIYGVGIGAGIGYSLGIPIGGHLRGGLANRTFALNMAAITVLTGVLAYVDYGLYNAYDEKSLRFTIPLNLLAPPIASYLIGRNLLP